MSTEGLCVDITASATYIWEYTLNRGRHWLCIRQKIDVDVVNLFDCCSINQRAVAPGARNQWFDEASSHNVVCNRSIFLQLLGKNGMGGGGKVSVS